MPKKLITLHSTSKVSKTFKAECSSKMATKLNVDLSWNYTDGEEIPQELVRSVLRYRKPWNIDARTKIKWKLEFLISNLGVPIQL